MPDNLPQKEPDVKLSQRAGEWKQILEEATDLVIDFITLIERARNLYMRARSKPAESEKAPTP